MGILTPTTSSLNVGQTQQFSTDISSPIWTLDRENGQSVGSLNQSGLYTADNSQGRAVIRAHTSAWTSFSSNNYVKGADDILRRKNAPTGYYETAVANGKLTLAGDKVHLISFTTSPFYWTIGEYGVPGGQNYIRIHIDGISEWVNGVKITDITGIAELGNLKINDVITFELISGSKFKIYKNYILIYTGTTAIPLDVLSGYQLNVGKWHDFAGGKVYPPRFEGFGIIDYEEAPQAEVIINAPAILPTSAELIIQGDQQFTVENLPNKIWTLDQHSKGSLPQSGLFSLDNSQGRAGIRAHTPAWESFSSNNYTKGPDDTLTVKASPSSSFETAKPAGSLSKPGDKIHIIAFTSSPFYWTFGEYAIVNGHNFLRIHGNAISEWVANSKITDTTVAGFTPLIPEVDTVSVELTEDRKFKVYKNGILVYTGTTSIPLEVRNTYKVNLGGFPPPGGRFLPPKYEGSGIINYTEIEAEVTVKEPVLIPGPIAAAEISEISKFAVSDLPEPIWTLGNKVTATPSIDQLGNLTTGPLTGSVQVRVHTSAWESYSTNNFTLYPDDTLIVNPSPPNYYQTLIPNGRLSRPGDKVHIVSFTSSPFYWTFGDYALAGGGNYLRIHGDTISEWVGASMIKTTTVAGFTPLTPGQDIITVELLENGKFKVYKNFVLVYTGTNTIPLTVIDNYRINLGGFPTAGGQVLPPQFEGDGIINYTEKFSDVNINLISGQGLEFYGEPKRGFPTDGSSVAYFQDYSANSRNMVGGANLPIFKTNIINGQPVIRFDGTDDPLVTTDTFTVQCGWIVLKFDEAVGFSDYQGVLSGQFIYDILTSETVGTEFYDFGVDLYEFRSNDQIYPPATAPAPMGEFKIIFFRFWKPFETDGLQLGQQRNFTSRKFDGDVAFLSVSSRSFCESDIRKYSERIALEFGLTLSDVYKYQGNTSSVNGSITNANFYNPPEGDKISEVIEESKSIFRLSFTSRRLSEVKYMMDFHKSHYGYSIKCLYRDYSVLPPRDIEGYIESEYEKSGSINNYSYSFLFKEN